MTVNGYRRWRGIGLIPSNGGARDIERLAGLGVHRAVVLVRPPYVDAIARLAAGQDGRP